MDHWMSLWTTKGDGRYGPANGGHEGRRPLWARRSPTGRQGRNPRDGTVFISRPRARRRNTTRHPTARRERGTERPTSTRPTSGARAPAQRQARRGAVTSAGGFVPSNNFVIPTPQILALALASHRTLGGRRRPSPNNRGCGPDPSAPQHAASPRPSGQTPVGPVGEHHPLQRLPRATPGAATHCPRLPGCAHVRAVQTQPTRRLNQASQASPSSLDDSV